MKQIPFIAPAIFAFAATVATMHSRRDEFEDFEEAMRQVAEEAKSKADASKLAQRLDAAKAKRDRKRLARLQRGKP